MESIDKAIHGMVSKSSGCNESKRIGDLESPKSRGRTKLLQLLVVPASTPHRTDSFRAMATLAMA
jgi:hypothetical protein